MTNDITKPSTNGQGVMTSGNDVNPYLAYGESASGTRIVGKLLKYNRFGEFVLGEENDRVEDGTQLIALMNELYVGYVKWDGGRPVEHRIGRVIDNFQPPRRQELGDLDEEAWEFRPDGKEKKDPWQFTNYLVMKGVADEELVTFVTQSKGGISSIGALCRSYGQMMRSRRGEFPIVSLRSGSWESREYGEIKKPFFDIVDWCDAEAALASFQQAGGEPEPEVVAAPPPIAKPITNPTSSTLPKASIVPPQSVGKSNKPRF